MAVVPRSTIESQWVNATTILDQIVAFGSSNATNLIALIDTLQQSYRGDYTSEIEDATEDIRAAIAGTVTPGFARAVQRPFLKLYCKDVIGRKNVGTASDEDLLDELEDYLRDQAHFVQSRVFTFGSPAAAAANVGTTQIIRLTKDRWNFDIESGWVDQKRIRCILDHNTGRDKGNELWEIEGQSRLKDELQRSGSGLAGTLEGLTVEDSLLSNAGFQSFGGTAAVPTSITDWTPITSTGGSVTVNSTNFGFDSANVFRPGPADGDITYSLRVKSAGVPNLTQKITVPGEEFDKDVPYALAIIYNSAIFSGQGNLVGRLGKINTASVSVTGQGGWQVLIVPTTTDWAHWYEVFVEDDIQIDVDFTGLSSGSVLLGEVLLIPGQRFDNLWHWMLPSNGNTTWIAPRINDEFTITDVVADTSIIQKWVHRAWRRYFAHSNASSIGWSGS